MLWGVRPMLSHHRVPGMVDFEINQREVHIPDFLSNQIRISKA